MDLEARWPQLQRLFREAFQSSLHFSIASVTDDGTPHITPIGSLILTEPGKGLYFEIFTTHMPHNFKTRKRVCVMAVNSSRWLWLTALWRGKFAAPPAVRLLGTVGERRLATEAEKARWQRRVRMAKWLKGYELLWGRLDYVREITFDTVKPVSMGALTSDGWSTFDET
ncbi:MAG: pyridoxamine 5'-phosphate oxidase family protein [Blastocatellia bacterium]|nr:pyridoxamine 5'-phosphate oxidase family protein [Blastocatellia bacterium]